MPHLVLVTALWAFSFSLIGVYLTGHVDAYFAVLIRIILALALFAPLLKPGANGWRAALGLMSVGASQIGLMYLFLYQAFLFISVPEVLLFSIVTPIYITILEDWLDQRFMLRHLVTASLAVAGAAVIRYTEISSQFWTGFALMQGANLCFAAGQVGYRRLEPRLNPSTPMYRQFGWFFIGALPVAALSFGLFGDWSAIASTPIQWGVLTWLGLGASGLGYYLWNRGATLVDAATLAVMNNMLIPAGLAVNLLIWHHDTNLLRLLVGAAIMGMALLLNRRMAPRKTRIPS